MGVHKAWYKCHHTSCEVWLGTNKNSAGPLQNWHRAVTAAAEAACDEVLDPITAKCGERGENPELKSISSSKNALKSLSVAC